MTGLAEDAFRFVSARPVSAQHGQMWIRTAQLISRQLNGSAEPSMAAPMHQSLIAVAAATALQVFPSTAMTRGYLAGPGDVRRAVAYEDTHVSLPITIGDAATAAGTSAHALRAAGADTWTRRSPPTCDAHGPLRPATTSNDRRTGREPRWRRSPCGGDS